MQVLKVKIKPKLSRLDQFVSNEIKALTRSKAKKLIKDGYILVNNSQSDPSYKVNKGDSIKVEIPVPASINLSAETIPLDIVYEDKDLLVVNKQPGLVVHPTVNHPTGTLVNAILHHVATLSRADNLRPGIVHRLDKDTSGLMVIAKNQDSLESLKKQFKDRVVHKKYQALVQGNLKKEKGEIVASIARHPKFKAKFAVAQNGKEAATLYKVLERFGEKFSLLELSPQTGRTHQLRVHLAHIGHPIVGDKLYGGKMLLPRQFLHATELSLIHPMTKVELKFVTPLAEDLAKFLNKLRKN